MNVKAFSTQAILMLALSCAALPAQEFSADVVSTDGQATAASPAGSQPSHNSSRLFVSGDKMRLEIAGTTATVLLVNWAEQVSYALFPDKKLYDPLSGGLSEYFRTSDAENACPDWQKASAEDIDCEKVGPEVVEGRQTVKYRNKRASDSSISAVWIDQELKFVVKWEGAGAGVELRNIAESKQPAELFTLPPDYNPAKPKKSANKAFSKR